MTSLRHTDLGCLEGPVLVFGGPYSNIQATRSVLERARQLRAIPVCTGDVVAYCARPKETIAAIRAAGCAVVAGNCEQQLAAGSSECGCGFETGTVCHLLSRGWYGFADAQVGAAARTWMGALPDVVTFWHNSARYGVIHGGVSDVARFLWSTSPACDLEHEWDLLETVIGTVDHVIAGHSGIAFQRSLRRGTWTNAGVIGMPPHTGAQATQYAVLDASGASIHALHYDAEGAWRDMKRAGLTQGYDTALLSGYWPSEDVLPADLRRSLARG